MFGARKTIFHLLYLHVAIVHNDSLSFQMRWAPAPRQKIIFNIFSRDRAIPVDIWLMDAWKALASIAYIFEFIIDYLRLRGPDFRRTLVICFSLEHFALFSLFVKILCEINARLQRKYYQINQVEWKDTTKREKINYEMVECRFVSM